jgi:hypothetical protein
MSGILGKCLVTEEYKGKAWRRYFNLAGISICIACNGLDVFGALKTAVRIEVAAKGLL